MICDHQQGIPLALLPDRRPETVARWLKRFPSVQVVSRDGFTAFRQAISRANPAINQVYDRWHLIRNAKKQVDTHLASHMPVSINWSEAAEGMPIPLTASEKAAIARQSQKWSLILEIQAEHKSGKNLSELSREFQLDWRTIQKYVNLQSPPIDRRIRAKPIDAYAEEVIQLEQAGHTVKSIYQLVQGQGYEGTYSAVRSLVQSERKKRKYNVPKKISVSRRKLAAIIWKPRDEHNEEEQLLLKQCLSLYPSAKEFVESVQVLRLSFSKPNEDQFLQWMNAQLLDRTSPFHHYAHRLRSDLQAIRNSFIQPYSNGRLEGQINRLKTIKRVTYGRASLKLLEKRVLYRTQ